MNKISVLDHGFVELIDVMGTDQSILQAARHSTNSINSNDKKDRELIRYLMRHQHTSPFEFAETIWSIKLPIFVARQWFRHRTGSFNEVSARYTILETEFYTPTKERIKAKGKFNKQGSEGEIDELLKNAWLDSLNRKFENDEQLYNMANSFEISNELTRISLPVSTYTLMFFKMDLHNLLHFFKLRLDKHAQEEIRQYAIVMYNIVKEHFPLTCEAFEDYILNGKTFSKQELNIIKNLININNLNIELDNELEMQEFLNKLKD